MYTKKLEGFNLTFFYKKPPLPVEEYLNRSEIIPFDVMDDSDDSNEEDFSFNEDNICPPISKNTHDLKCFRFQIQTEMRPK